MHRGAQWDRIKGFVPGRTKGRRGSRTDNRTFLDALYGMACLGEDSVRQSGAIIAGFRWLFWTICSQPLPKKPIWNEWPMINSTIVCTHLHAAAHARSKVGDGCAGSGAVSRRLEHQNLRLTTEAPGLPIRLIAGSGQCNDVAFAHALIGGRY